MAKKDEASKTLLLHSGSLDSTVLGHHLNGQDINFISLFMSQSQTPAASELRAVTITAAMLMSPLEVIECNGLRAAYTSSPFSILVNVGNPGKHVLELGSTLLLSPALAYARRRGISTVYIGYTKLDADYSAEYTQEFLDKFSDLSEAAGYERVTFKAPFVAKSKADVVKIGAKAEELLASTWSCFLGEATHCGVCESCKARKAAFKAARGKDLTVYNA